MRCSGSWQRSRQYSATGCPGITRRAAITTSASRSGTAAPSTSTRDGRFRALSTPRSRNLREIPSTAHFTVPRTYEMLLPYLRQDATLREVFFSRLKIFFYAAAGLSQRVFDELQELAESTCGERLLWVTRLRRDGDRSVHDCARVRPGPTPGSSAFRSPAWS